ncbi:MAG: hypothetical protein JRJ51_07265 [Deltaproteobacteria bacterium]|nr:hypothetical protein [Deltaproteobacteria bacterium]
MFIASKKWATGDATSVTVDWNTANSDTGDIYVFAYLLRPSVGNLIEPVGYGVTTGASGGLTNNSGVMSAASSDQVYVVGFAVNDDKTTNFSAWEFNNSGTDFITEDAQLSEGGGSPANWSSGAAASGAIVITSARAVYVDYDDNGDQYGVGGITFKELPAELEQTAFRVRTADTVGLNTDSGWEAAKNVDASIDVDTIFRVRIRFKETAGARADSDRFGIWASKNGGAYTDVTSTTSGLEIEPSAQFNDGSSTTELLSGDGGTWSAGKGIETYSGAADKGFGLEVTEYEYSLIIDSADVVNGDYFDVRVYKDGTALDTYTQVPRITVVEGGSGTEYFQTVSATVTVTAALATNTFWTKVIAATTTITAGLANQVSFKRAIAATTTVTAGLAKKLSLKMLLAATVTVTAGLAQKKSFKRVIAVTTTVTAALSTRKIIKLALAATVTVTAALTKTHAYKRALAATTTVSAALSRTHALSKAIAALVTVTAALAQQRSFKRAIATTVTVTPLLVKKVGKNIAATVTVTAGRVNVVAKKYFQAIAATVTVTAGVVKQVGKKLNATTTITANAALARKYKRAVAATVTVTADVNKKMFKTIAATVTVTANMVRAAKYKITVAATTTITAALSQMRAFKRVIAATVTVTAGISRKMFKTIATTVTVTAGLAAAYTKKQAIAASTTVTATMTKNYTPAVAAAARYFIRSLSNVGAYWRSRYPK